MYNPRNDTRKEIMRKVELKTITKNNGKTRQLVVPNPKYKKELKEALETAIPLHNSYGTCSDKGIKQFILAHEKAKYIIKVDIENFFDSINLQSYMSNNKLTRFPNGYLIENCFYPTQMAISLGMSQGWRYKTLPQGFPTSPYIANLFMRRFDQAMEKYAKDNSYVYTRYFDDIVISIDRSTDVPETEVTDILTKIKLSLSLYDLKLNSEKTVHYPVIDFYSVLGVTASRNEESDTITLTTKAEHKKYILKTIVYTLHHMDDFSDEEHIKRYNKGMGHMSWIHYIEDNSANYNKCVNVMNQYKALLGTTTLDTNRLGGEL